MVVGIDATSWHNRRGYGRFARNAVRSLVETDRDTSYVLYVNGSDPDDLPEGAGRRRLPMVRTRPTTADSSRGVGELLRIGWEVSRDRLDAFLFPSIYSYFPVVGVPSVVGVHDVIADSLPQLTLPRRRNRAMWRLKEGLAVRRAARVFTVSLAARAEVAARFGIAPSRLAVVPEAPDRVFWPRDAAAQRPLLGRLGLEPDRFLLYSGGISPHKNIETLLRAHARLASRPSPTPRLVLVGELEDSAYLSAAAEVKALIGELGLADHVVLPGFVSDDELACLYSAALAVVIPSLAEGFGLPAVEAAACGAPVVLSELPAHRETMDGAALFFHPTDTESLEAALARLLAEPERRSDLRERGLAAVAEMSWDVTAERLRAVIEEAAEVR